MSKTPRFIGLFSILLLLTVACSDDDGSDPDAGMPDVDEQDVTGEPDVDEGDVSEEADADTGPVDIPEYRTTDCDPLIEEQCSLPWPSNHFLEADEERMTGYTVDFGPTSLPHNRSGAHIEPEAYRQLDGYGLGTPVIALFPDVDTSQMPAEDSIEDSVEDDDREAFYYKVTEDGLEPVPFWAELDVHADDPEEQVLYLRPAVILEENAHYVVGFRNLTDNDGEDFEPSEAFQKFVSGDAANDPDLGWRQERFDEIFDLLEDVGVDRDELTLAWDFNTGSTEGLHADLLHIIDEGVAIADEEGIDIEITDVSVPEGDPYLAYEIEGTFRVPHFMEESDRSGSLSYLIHRDEDGNPAQNGWREADFWLQIPHTAIDGAPHGLVKYGHGMLGRGGQVGGDFNSKIAYENELIFFACDFTGFSQSDVPQAIEALGDPTLFEEISDRMHQGVLEYVLLTKAMQEQLETIPDDEAFDDEELEADDLDLTVDDDRIYYSGISQGGIYGVTFLAVDPTITHGHFGVPGHNYAMLLERSSNYYSTQGDIGYDAVVNNAFPDRIDQSMIIPVIQLLWDKIDPVSYLRRLSDDPFDETMPKYGLFGLAKGDYQVAVVTKEITARSEIGIPILENYDQDRGEPWGVDVAEYPHQGSGIVNYDFGNPWPPAGNIPPDDEPDDPHGLPRRLDEHNEQMIEFFDNDQIIDVCGGAPCYFPDEW